jgi:hypothetical protein
MAKKHAELAQLLAAVLAHPATPPDLWRGIADRLTEYSSRYLTKHATGADHIEKSLVANEQFERARNGGD